MSESNFGVEDKNADSRASSELDLYEVAVNPGAKDEFLRELNLGLGNYSEAEQWQQVESYGRGLFAESAFGRRIVARAIEETRTDIGLNGYHWYDQTREKTKEVDGWRDLDESERTDRSRAEFVEETGAKVWGHLSEEQQREAVEDITGLGDGWTPPFWRMIQIRHETSRSKEARLMDNLFGRVSEVKGEVSEKARERLAALGGGGVR